MKYQDFKFLSPFNKALQILVHVFSLLLPICTHISLKVVHPDPYSFSPSPYPDLSWQRAGNFSAMSSPFTLKLGNAFTVRGFPKTGFRSVAVRVNGQVHVLLLSSECSEEKDPKRSQLYVDHSKTKKEAAAACHSYHVPQCIMFILYSWVLGG